MELLDYTMLAKELRSRTKSVQSRFWVCSPFLGSLADVRRILGTDWATGRVDVRLLIDVANMSLANREAIKAFLYGGKVKSLTGLHAKLYIVDSFAIVSSANLTRTAFTKRYEVAALMAGREASEVINLFDRWWRLPEAHAVSPASLPSSKPRGRTSTDELNTSHLTDLWTLPPDPGGLSFKGEASFFDYDVFLECYEDFVQKYYSIQRVWNRSPKYFETDSFLNYLYHEHPNLPSRKYRKRKPAVLADRQKAALIRKYAKEYRSWLSSGQGDSRFSRIESSRIIRAVFRRNVNVTINPREIRSVFDRLNCQIPIVKAKLLNNNKPSHLREAFRALADDNVPLQKRMVDFYNDVPFCGRSTIQELVGFLYPGKFPLRNANSNSGLRMFGYDVARY